MAQLPLDFVLSFCREMIPGKGEDSFCHSFCDSAGMVAVFDGCGGAGARTHDYYSGHSEAYMASRLCAGAFYEGFRESFPTDLSPDALAAQVFGPGAVGRLREMAPPQDPDSFQIKGSMVRTLPTTAAAALVRRQPRGLEVGAIWAGDSRVYVLDARGLAQVSTDDTSVPDPMENLYEDGVLRNVVCSDRKVSFHCRTVTVPGPAAVFAATDGCFGYVSTPMEFEGLLLQTLMQAQSPDGWEKALAEAVGSVAGDDHALCLAALEFGSFEALQKTLAPRLQWLEENILRQVRTLPLEDRQSRFALWEQYRGDYLRLAKDGPAQ